MKRKIDFSVKIGTDVRKYEVKVPTVEKLIEIENRKALGSGNNYRGIMTNSSTISDTALDMVDMNAYIAVLCPKLIEDLETETIFDLDIFDVAPIMKSYKEQMLPWIESWTEALSGAISKK